MSSRLALIGGGARSGKSRFAEALARARGTRRLYLATAVAGDREMEERIAAHRRDRGDRFVTVEEPRDPARALAEVDPERTDVVVIDCLTLWLSNLVCAGAGEAEVDREVARLVEALAERRLETIVVTNEVGLGIVPEHALGRLFRDVAGRAHQRLAAEADEVYFAALGAMLRLKPPPIVALFADDAAVEA